MQQIKSIKQSEAVSYFDFMALDNTTYLSGSYALRYDVYCQEQNFLDASNYPDGLEIDEFDKTSLHVGSVNRSGVLVGTLRLVKSSPLSFPFMENCEIFDEYKHLCDPENPDIVKAAELSRLAVSKTYRRRKGDGLYGLVSQPDNPSEEDEARIFRSRRPEIVLGLYKAMYQQSKRQGINIWFAAMEKTLLRLLSRFRFTFTPIGPEVDYYGPVTPYFADIEAIERQVFENMPELFAEFVDGLEPEFIPDYAK